MSASPHCPPLELESDRLRLSGAIGRQSHDRHCKPQQRADGHEGERHKQVEASDGEDWPGIVCSCQKQDTCILVSIIEQCSAVLLSAFEESAPQFTKAIS